MRPEWFRPRRYRHLDAPVGERFLRQAERPEFVARHDFLPLLHFVKTERRYKRQPDGTRAIEAKDRDIMFASHRDACILSLYSARLNALLEAHYRAADLEDCALAYRRTGFANYDFAAEALAFARSNAPVTILAFDVTKFFNTLDHRLLKERLRRILGGTIPDDWYRVLRALIHFSFIDLGELRTHPAFEDRFGPGQRGPIGTIAELKAAGVPIGTNKGAGRGIPQGTPISASLSNLYMTDFDAAAKAACTARGALYRRYSDDILVICRAEDAANLERAIMDLVRAERLEINPGKTERTTFDPTDPAMGARPLAQYLGFEFGPKGALIRRGSLARRWRKLRYHLRRLHRIAEESRRSGGPLYTKSFHRRFTRSDVRNFGAYGRRSAKAFGGAPGIRRQVVRLERAAQKGLKDIRDGKRP